MRRALRKAGWALAAAGGIGIAAPAVAQTQPVHVIGPGGHVEQAGEVIVITEAQARFEEAQVELGLLADPMLFSYGLGAHVQGTALEVRGFVPTEAVREQAVRVAREQTAMHVIDRLKVMPNLATRCSVEKPEAIQRDAKALVEEVVPQYGRGIDVKCDARGRVTLTGSIGSYEDRVLVSRKLRQVSGCSCVVNQLDVVSPGGEAKPAETTTAVHVPVVPPVTPHPAIRKTEPAVPEVPARTVSVPAHKETEAPHSVPRTDPEPVVLPAVPPAPPVPSHMVAPPPPKEIDPPGLTMPRVYQEPVPPPPPPPAPTVKPLPVLPPVPKPVQPPAPMSIDVPPLPPVKVESPPPAPRPDVLPKAPAPSIDKDRAYGSGAAGATPLDLPPMEPAKPAPAVKPPVEPAKPEPTVKPPMESAKPAPVVKPLAEPAKPEVAVKPPMESVKPAPVVKPPAEWAKPDLTFKPAVESVKPAPVLKPPVEPVKPAPTVKVPVVVNEPAVPSPKPTPLPPVVPLTPRPAVTQHPAVPSMPPLPKLPAIDNKHDRGGSEESYVSEGSISFDDDPPPAKPVVPAKAPTTLPTLPPAAPKSSSLPAPAPLPAPTGGAKAPSFSPIRPVEGTMTLTPPPMPPNRPAADATKLPAPPTKPPAPPAPPKPNVPPAVRLKERLQGVIGPAYEVKVTPRGKNRLMLEITGGVAGEEARIMKQITPVLQSDEFRGMELNIDVVTPEK